MAVVCYLGIVIHINGTTHKDALGSLALSKITLELAALFWGYAS